ncbi:hypothetical protein AB0F91_29045 [Amycolatopsis sp. NPDC023774]|uniref:hypothetical protein n=1 Tax=Amycolatopsis sp. NPDC023774 TaxID=3155015 RepID=UPI0033C13D07
MGRAWGFWVPLAVLGFAELILAAVQLVTAEHGAHGVFVDLYSGPVHRVPGGLLGPGPGGLQFLTQDQVPLLPSTYATALGWPIALAVVVALVLAGYARRGRLEHRPVRRPPRRGRAPRAGAGPGRVRLARPRRPTCADPRWRRWGWWCSRGTSAAPSC